MQVRSIQLTCGGSRLNAIREQTELRYSVKEKAKVVFSLDQVDHERYRIIALFHVIFMTIHILFLEPRIIFRLSPSGIYFFPQSFCKFKRCFFFPRP